MRKQLPLFLFLTILFSILLISFSPPVKATTIFSDGFESGDFSAWTGINYGNGGSVSVVTSPVHHGTYAEGAIQGEIDAWAVAYKNFGTTYSIIYARNYVQLSSLPSSGVRLQISPVIFEGSAAAHVLVGAYIYNDAGTLKWDLLYRTDSVEENHAYSTTPTINANQWYCVEVKFVQGNGNGQVGLYIDGNLVISVTGLTNNAYSAGRLEAGVYSSSNTNITVYVDCVVVADAYIGVEGGATTLRFYDTFSLSPSITDGRRVSFSRQSSFSESFSYDFERSLIVSRKSIFSALFSINDGRLITLSRKSIFSELFSVNDRRLIILSRTSFFSQAFSIDTILSILKLNEHHFSTVITFSYSLTDGRSITIFRGSTFAETFSIDHTFSLFQFGHYSFSSLFNVPFTIYDVVSSTAPYGMGDMIAIAILALIIAICAAVIAITWD